MLEVKSKKLEGSGTNITRKAFAVKSKTLTFAFLYQNQ